MYALFIGCAKIDFSSRWGRGAVGSAPRWHRGGRGFESHRLHQISPIQFKLRYRSCSGCGWRRRVVWYIRREFADDKFLQQVCCLRLRQCRSARFQTSTPLHRDRWQDNKDWKCRQKPGFPELPNKLGCQRPLSPLQITALAIAYRAPRFLAAGSLVEIARILFQQRLAVSRLRCTLTSPGPHTWRRSAFRSPARLARSR